MIADQRIGFFQKDEMVTAQEIEFDASGRVEEEARANLYGLLAELFYSPPSKALIETIAACKAPGGGLIDTAWNALSNACATIPPEEIQEEYERLFISVGKPEIILCGSYYMAGFMMEKPLAELRSELIRLGLERAESVAESEDHIAALCEVMRYLISANSSAGTSAESHAADGPSAEHAFIVQKKFFAEYVQPWAGELCDKLTAHPDANFYAALSNLTQVFFEIESEAFEMV